MVAASGNHMAGAQAPLPEATDGPDGYSAEDLSDLFDIASGNATES